MKHLKTFNESFNSETTLKDFFYGSIYEKDFNSIGWTFKFGRDPNKGHLTGINTEGMSIKPTDSVFDMCSGRFFLMKSPSTGKWKQNVGDIPQSNTIQEGLRNVWLWLVTSNLLAIHYDFQYKKIPKGSKYRCPSNGYEIEGDDGYQFVKASNSLTNRGKIFKFLSDENLFPIGTGYSPMVIVDKVLEYWESLDATIMAKEKKKNANLNFGSIYQSIKGTDLEGLVNLSITETSNGEELIVALVNKEALSKKLTLHKDRFDRVEEYRVPIIINTSRTRPGIANYGSSNMKILLPPNFTKDDIAKMVARAYPYMVYKSYSMGSVYLGRTESIRACVLRGAYYNRELKYILGYLKEISEELELLTFLQKVRRNAIKNEGSKDLTDIHETLRLLEIEDNKTSNALFSILSILIDPENKEELIKMVPPLDLEIGTKISIASSIDKLDPPRLKEVMDFLNLTTGDYQDIKLAGDLGMFGNNR